MIDQNRQAFPQAKADHDVEAQELRLNANSQVLSVIARYRPSL